MGLFTRSWDHNYCRKDPFPSKRDCRQGIEECPRFLGVDVVSTDISENMPKNGDPQYRPFCFQDITPTERIHELESRPQLPGSGCFSAKVGPVLPIRVPPLLPDFKNSETVIKTISSKDDHSDTSLALSTMVSTTTVNVNSDTNSAAKVTSIINKPFREDSSTNRKLLSGTGDMASFRDSLSKEGISSRACELILNSRRGEQLGIMSQPGRSGICGVVAGGADPFKCPLNFVLDFLSELYEKGLQQRTIGVHRSAIYAYHCTVDGTPVGKHPRVSALFAGISNLRPPLPKYGFTWDVEIVLQFFLS